MRQQRIKHVQQHGLKTKLQAYNNIDSRRPGF